jgi:SAM-dependent methyltransferase
MSVAGHLSIQVAEYDARIRTFVPDYELLIATAARALLLIDISAPTVVDLGIGTGALAAYCGEVRPAARLIGIDADPAMLDLARARLFGHPSVEFIESNFLEVALPPCDAIVACISLHHISSADAKRRFYASCRQVLRAGGLLISADCFPARDERLAAHQRRLWLEYLEGFYSATEAEAYLQPGQARTPTSRWKTSWNGYMRRLSNRKLCGATAGSQ